MKKFKLTVIDFLLFILIMLQVNFFDLISLPYSWSSWNSNVNKYAILIISIIIWLISFIYKQNNHPIENNNNLQFSISTLVFSIILLIVLLGSSLIYGQTIFNTFQNMYWYFIFPLLYFGLKEYLKNKDNFVKFNNIIVFVGVVYALLYLLYSKNIITLHTNAVIDIQNMAAAKAQYGFTRLQASSDFIFFVSFCMSSTTLMGIKKLNIKFVIQQFILIANLFFVGQVRVYFAIALILFVFVLFIKNINLFKKTRSILMIFGVIAGAFLVIFMINKLNFFGGGDRQASSIVRSEEISYYLSHMYDNKLFGLGFPDMSTNYYLIRGFSPTYQAAVYYLEDVGIFGFIAIFGILGIFYFILFIDELIKIIVNSKYKFIIIVILLAYLATYLTLIPLNVSRIMLMPFYLIIVTLLTME